MNTNRKIRVGRRGEDLAVTFLTERGVKILGRNIRSRYGEIDIVGILEEQLVFFEVRTRTSATLGYPEDSINTRKREHMAAAAEAYIQANPALKNEWRIDVLAVELNPKTPPRIEWFENAV